MDFPFRQYDDAKLLAEFASLKKLENSVLKKRRTGYRCSNAFFQFERLNTPSFSHKSCLEFWAMNKCKVIEYHKNSTRSGDLQGAVQFLNHAPAQFPPNVAMWFYRYFGATTVFDPFAGWGDRCLAAMALDINYIGVDSNRALFEPYKQMIRFYPHTGRIRLFCKPVETVDATKHDFDLIFTSPPFWKKGSLVENYGGMTEKNYRDFLENILIPLIMLGQRRGVPVCLYIPSEMANDIDIPYRKRFSFDGRGNKMNQKYTFYCY